MTTAAADADPSAGTPKQERSRLSTQRLLHAASQLIAERGYDRTTLAEIGKRAGYSHGLVTQRFGSKDGMLEALLERATSSWELQLAEHVGDRIGVEALVALLQVTRENIKRSPELMRALYALNLEAFKPIPSLHTTIIELHEATLRTIEGYVQRGIDAGVVRPLGAESISRLFLAVIRGSEYQWLLDPAGFDIDSTLALFAAQLGDQLGT